ncbi:MAG: rhomboid family intramembrane serine protease, partial [Bacteroidales bacterium]|nr:rhomboid family intramembrane serine protease [Bacteroidales bacterium]
MNFTYNRGGGFLSSIPPVTKNIIIINVLIWIMTELNQHFMIETFAMFYPSSPFFRPWQIVTHMFMHGGFWHIFFNMYTLFIFGSVLERVWGTKKFLFFYFATGLGAVALHTGVQWIEAQS